MKGKTLGVVGRYGNCDCKAISSRFAGTIFLARLKVNETLQEPGLIENFEPL